MAGDDARRLYGGWLEMWSGNLTLADQIVGPDFLVHQATAGPVGPQEMRGPAGLTRLVSMGRAPFADLAFAVGVGAISALATPYLRTVTVRGPLA